MTDILAEKGNFRNISHAFNNSLGKDIRKSQGIYFTPKSQRDRLWTVVANYMPSPRTILEPSFGSGEFLYDAAGRFPDAVLSGVELNEQLFDALKLNRGYYSCCSFLDYHIGSKVELIVGNPPYFVVETKDERCMTGRGNIYVQFIYKCLTEHLAEDGVLAFILPTSFYNCRYYQPCRNFIRDNTTVLHLENMDGGFYGTDQDTMLMVVRNTRGAAAAAAASATTAPYFLEFGGASYLSPYWTELSRMLTSANVSTVEDLGLSVKTGDVVWNEHKDKLTDAKDPGAILIIYTANIVSNSLVLGNLKGGKKQYIRGFKRPPTVGPALCVSRGYGNSYHFNFVKIPAGQEFFGENHVNVICGPEAALDRLKKSLEDSRTTEFIKKFIGNGALSKTELETVLPVF